ncbi:MAG: cell division protein FtsA [Candidatus Omnitrophota bacterium]|nr:cell division protein FtsA [Candidatus Omnitrophota bacterium]
MKEKIIAALDIGTSKVCALIAGLDSEGQVRLIAGKLTASKGVSNGLIKDLAEVSSSVSEILSETGKAGQVEIYSVVANVNGGHIKSRNNQAMLELAGPERKVKSSDIRKITEVAKSVPLPMDEKILQVIPARYMVDDQTGIKNPLKMAGSRLGLEVHLITGSISHTQNTVSAINQAGYDVGGIIPESLACSCAVLSEKEKELGVILINIGAATTDIIIFINGCPVHTEVVPVGSEGLTRMLSSVLRTSLEDAEIIKKRYGSVFSSRLNDQSLIMVPGIDGRPSNNISVSFLSRSIMPYATKMITRISKRIEASGYKEKAVAGAVATGGGTLLEGIVEKIEEVLGLPVRMGCSSGIHADGNVISNPGYTAAIGLAKYGLQYAQPELRWYDRGGWAKFGNSIRSFIEEYF